MAESTGQNGPAGTGENGSGQNGSGQNGSGQNGQGYNGYNASTDTDGTTYSTNQANESVTSPDGPTGVPQGAQGNRSLYNVQIGVDDYGNAIYEGNSMVPAGTPLGTEFEGPAMTVDEVYGKSNQAIVESQGDYAALSNEKSNVETSTFGKQDAISVTPLSVTENKAEAENAAVQSIEGLTFEQKDKQSQDVLDSRKSRDEAEAEDKSNQMRNQILALNENKVTDEDADSFFKIGESRSEKAFNEEDGKRTAELKQQKQELNEAIEKTEKAKEEAKKAIENSKQLLDEMDHYIYDPNASQEGLRNIAAKYGITVGSVDGAEGLALENLISKIADEANMKARNAVRTAEKTRDSLNALTTQYEESKKNYVSWRTDAWAKVTNSTDYSFDNAINEISKSDDPLAPEAAQALTDVQTSIEAVQDAASKLTGDFANDDFVAVDDFVKAVTQLNKNTEDALKGNRFANTSFNKTFASRVADANNFTFTLADGSIVTFADFMTKAATQSPHIAAAMYNAKADRLEADGHPVLAKVNRVLAGAMDSWIGSKFGFADNQVISQFNQMAKTDARATYAAYNNVINDTTGKYSEADKAEAQAAIAQSNSLMTASTALQASTGFFSGIGDSYSDGVYGKTDPGALNTYQKTLNTISNFAKITLGLGITPGANKAYQNMFYMAGDEVNRSLLFNKDFDADGFALCQEYGNSAAANMIVGAGELATSIALMFNPATLQMGINLAIDSVQAFFDGLYGVQKDARKSQQYTEQVLSYFKDAQNIAAKSGNEEAVETFTGAMSQIENFELQSDEVNDLDKWLEGSGSNTADNGKFNQSLSYDEWLRLIEADPTMQDYAKKLIAEKR